MKFKKHAQNVNKGFSCSKDVAKSFPMSVKQSIKTASNGSQMIRYWLMHSAQSNTGQISQQETGKLIFWLPKIP